MTGRTIVAIASGILCLVLPASAAAQATPAPAMLRVFLDCPDCDEEFLRQNVAFVDYVRDRMVADVHVLVTTQGTGGGGLSWTLKVIGVGRFQGQDRTLTFTTPQTATSDERRREFARVFKIGIVGYASDSSVATELNVTYQPKEAAATEGPVKDPWNYWVFRANGGGEVNGEQLSSFRSYRLSFSASRTTAAWKINLSASKHSSRNTFEIDDETTIESQSHSWDVDSLIVKSLGPKWSFGGRANASQSSFSNLDRSFRGSAGIEYDVFPYAESSQRSLTIQYSLGATHFDYRDLTIFDRLTETVPIQTVNVSLGLRQPWGSVSASGDVTQHLNHRDRWRAGVFGSADVRLFKGFSFNMFGNYSKIKDQIGLPKGSASTEEILLRIRQQRTGYSYFVGFGISYSFGSIFNSIVNPRFGGSGGGGMMIIMG